MTKSAIEVGLQGLLLGDALLARVLHGRDACLCNNHRIALPMLGEGLHRLDPGISATQLLDCRRSRSYFCLHIGNLVPYMAHSSVAPEQGHAGDH